MSTMISVRQSFPEHTGLSSFELILNLDVRRLELRLQTREALSFAVTALVHTAIPTSAKRRLKEVLSEVFPETWVGLLERHLGLAASAAADYILSQVSVDLRPSAP